MVLVAIVVAAGIGAAVLCNAPHAQDLTGYFPPRGLVSGLGVILDEPARTAALVALNIRDFESGIEGRKPLGHRRERELNIDRISIRIGVTPEDAEK